jgi:hypothetical protein
VITTRSGGTSGNFTGGGLSTDKWTCGIGDAAAGGGVGGGVWPSKTEAAPNKITLRGKII